MGKGSLQIKILNFSEDQRVLWILLIVSVQCLKNIFTIQHIITQIQQTSELLGSAN